MVEQTDDGRLSAKNKADLCVLVALSVPLIVLPNACVCIVDKRV